MGNSRWSIVYMLAILFARSCAVYKRWLPDTNFDNPDNWNLKRIPCGNDVTIIPEDSPIVYVQLNTTIKELLLPKNGELILGQNMSLGFTGSPVAGCQEASGDLEFAAVNPKSWLNPDNWCMAPTERGACDRSQPTLDVERVPCRYDDVIFPRDHFYFVDLSEDTPMLSTKSVKISGTTFTNFSFVEYLNKPEGEKMFRLSASGASGERINITRISCEDPRGCPCGNDRPQIARVICSHVDKFCRRPRCSQTIQPVGACCRMCGVVFNITQGYGFNFNSFVSSVKTKFLSNSTQDGVNATFSITNDGWLQMVLTDVTGQKSSALSKLILADFNNDLANGGHTYAIDKVQLSLATDSGEPSHSAQTDTVMTSGSIAGIVIGILAAIIVIIIVVVIFIFRRTGRQIPVPNLPGWGPRARGGPSPKGVSQPHTASHVDPGFANPLYDTSPFDDGNVHMKEMEMISSLEDQPTFDVKEGGFNNPLYGVAGPYLFSDPSAVEGTSDATAESRKGGAGTPSSTATVTIEHPSSVKGDSTI